MGGTPDTWVTPDSDSSCSESAAADTSAGKGRCMRRWGSFPSGGGVGGGRFAARTDAVRSYPRVRSSPHLPYPDRYKYILSSRSYTYKYLLTAWEVSLLLGKALEQTTNDLTSNLAPEKTKRGKGEVRAIKQ